MAEWLDMTLTSGLEPMIDLARSLAEHRCGVLRRFTSKVSNGLLEAISSLVRGRQTTGGRLPDHTEPEGDRLPRRRQAGFQTGHVITHTKWQRAFCWRPLTCLRQR